MIDQRSANASPIGSSSTEDLEGLYRSWGILDLLDETITAIPGDWLAILQIARALLDRREVPGLTLPERIFDLVAREEEVQYERRFVKRTVVTRRPHLPEDPDVRPIESVSELPRIIASQLMWQYINPELFLYRVYTHDVLVREIRDGAPETPDEEEAGEEVMVPLRGHHRRRQRVLVLRDTSHSMRDNNKGIFARAIALAYLIKAQEEGAEVADRSFANTVHPRLEARRPGEFGAIARRILTERFVGTTDIAAALDATAREIRREELGLNPHARAKTEILLISDCENPVQLPPLPPGVVIHTLHLEGGREGLMLRTYPERLREIQEVSTLFVRVDTSALRIPDATREAWMLREEAGAIEESIAEREGLATPVDPALRERAAQARRLMQVYERMPGAGRNATGFRWQLGGRRSQEAGQLLNLLRALFRLLFGQVRHNPIDAAPAPATVNMTVQSSHGDGMGRFVFRQKG